MADIRNIKILGTVEASTNSSIILTGSNTLIKKVLDDGRVLFEVNDAQVVVSGNMMLSSSGAFNSVLTSSDSMYDLDTALHAIDQTIQDKGAEIRSAYEAVRFRHFGTLGPMGLTRLNLTQLAISGSDYFASTNIKDITVDLLIDTNGDGNYRNDMASIILFASGSNLYADIDAPSAAGNPFRFIAVNETLLDVINTRASYNVPSSGDGITAQEISASFVQSSDVNNTLASYATLSGVSSSFVTSTQVTSALEPYATLADVSGTFAKTSDVSSTYTTPAQVSTQINSALTPYATSTGVSSSFTTLGSTQTITGVKTFSNSATFNSSITTAGFTSTDNSSVLGALSINGNTTLGSTGDSQVTFFGDQINIESNTLNFSSNKLVINKTANTVSASGKFVGKFDGDGSLLTKVTASYITTGSAIATFTDDVRNQFTAGTNITLTNGVIGAAGTVTPTQVTSALVPYATLTGVSSSFLLSNASSFANAITASGAVLGYLGSTNLYLGGYSGLGLTGEGNISIGYASGKYITAGSYNVLAGFAAGEVLRYGSYNIAFGYGALGANTSASYNIALGERAFVALNNIIGTSGHNIAIGDSAGQSFSGSYNTDVNNIFLGYSAGSSITHLYGGMVIGNDAGGDINNLSGAIIIANGMGNRLMKGLRTAAGKINSTFNGTMTADNFTASAGGIEFSDGTRMTSAGLTGATLSSSFASLSANNTFTSDMKINGSASINNILIKTSRGVNSGIEEVNISNISINNGGSFSQIGANNTILGTNINFNSSAAQNTAIGYKALSVAGNTGCTAVGSLALVSCSAGFNTAVGHNSSYSVLNSTNNVSIGYDSLYSAVTSHNNTAIGVSSLRSYTSPIDGNFGNNVAIGASAGFNLITGSSNIFLGRLAGSSVTSLYQGVIIGANNGSTINNTTGSIIISDGVGNIRIRSDGNGLVTVPGALTVSGNVILGDATTDSITLNAATMSLGSGTGILNIDSNTFYVDGNNNRVGIGKTNPTSVLDVSGTVTITGSANISTVLKLSTQNPLPDGSVGMIAVSGTNLYFHNGTAWTMIV